MPKDQSSWREVRLLTGDRLALVNIGAGGVLVESSRRLMPGVSVVVQLAGHRATRTLDARVVRCAVAALSADEGVRYVGALEFTVTLDVVEVARCTMHTR